MPQSFIKDGDATLDYTVDWSDWLGVDTIVTSIWAPVTGITIENDDNTTTTTTVWLSGGTANATYALTNHIVTAGGREDDRTITIRIRNR